MSKNKPVSSINDYPEHLNPFYEGDHHNRLRFWDRGKNFIRRSSFSFSDIKTLPRRLSFRSKTKTDSQENLRQKHQSNSTVLQRKIYQDNSNSYAKNDIQLRKTNTLLPANSINNVPNELNGSPSRPSTSLGLNTIESQTQTFLRKKRRAPPPPTLKQSEVSTSKHSLSENKQECHSNNPFDDENDEKTKSTVEVHVTPTPPPRTKLKEDEQKHNDSIEGSFGYKNEITLSVNDEKPDKTASVKNNEEIKTDRKDAVIDDKGDESPGKEITVKKDGSGDKEKDVEDNENVDEENNIIEKDRTDVIEKKIVKIEINLSTETDEEKNSVPGDGKIEVAANEVEEKQTNVENDKNIIENSKMEIIKYIDIITERIDKNKTESDDDKILDVHKDENIFDDSVDAIKIDEKIARDEKLNNKNTTCEIITENTSAVENHKLINSSHSIIKANKTDINFNTETNEKRLKNYMSNEDVISDPDKLLAMVQKLQLEVEQMTFDD